MWRKYLTDFKSYIAIERSYSINTLEAYVRDCEKFFTFMEENHPDIGPQNTQLKHLRSFLKSIATTPLKGKEGQLLKISSQKRTISSIRTFFKYLLFTDVIKDNPCELLDTQKMEQKLPVVLTDEEINRMIDSIDKSSFMGYRDALIIEVLYACGLRISELLNMRIEDVFTKQTVIRVIGKGDKERLVPICSGALRRLNLFINNHRTKIKLTKASGTYIFLNQRGGKLTRQYVFQMIKDTAKSVGITKNVHPHTLRHSFATALIKGGANLIAVRDMMGHVSVASTQIYTHLSTKHLRETIMLYHPLYNKKAWNKKK